MKPLTIIVSLLLLSVESNSQITATTSSGKIVILKSDGTWKYADNSKIDEKPCIEFHAGNLTIKNNTDKDIYFYYHFQSIYGLSPSFVKVKAKSSKAINSLSSGLKETKGHEKYKYAWKATLETQRNEFAINEMEGIESGTFVISDCESTEIEVDN